MLGHWRYRRRCHAVVRQCRQKGVAEHVSECSDIHVDRLANTPLIAVDLEMTGLDARNNRIIAMGWTFIDEGRIRFGTNRHLLINSEQSVGHSAAIHEMTDSDIASGVSLEAGLEALFDAARGRVWVFHHAGLDVAFLQQACTSWAGIEIPFMVLDTMQMELAMRSRRNLAIPNGELRLGKLRKHYKLPDYTAHNALIDACSTAELLLAIAGQMDPTSSLRLGSHLNFF